MLLIPVFALLTSCEKSDKDAVIYEPVTEIGRIFTDKCPEIAQVFKDTSFVVAVGVEETDLMLQTAEGYPQQFCILKIDTNTPGLKLKVSMPNNNKDVSTGWKRQTLTEMAEAMDKTRARVVGMVNADFWQMSDPINPRGPVHMGGTIISDKWDYDPVRFLQQALSFVGITYDGKMVIADRSQYAEMKDNLRECTGSGFMMLVNGNFPGTEWKQRDPRTAIGYTEDGIVYFLTADGRQKIADGGLTYKEMGYIFQSLGCVNAANLDGGGSAQFLIRHPLAQVFQIRNNPSDGAERPVINGWTVVVDEP